MKKIGTTFSLLLFGLILFPFVQNVDAHVAIKPNEVPIGTLQAFTVGVPNEKDQPVVAIKLLLPQNLLDITPTVKNGWTITFDKTDGTVTSLTWTGGVIPSGQRDDFSFSARVPDKTTTLIWKTYQTFEDGTVISWDREPKKQIEEEEGNSGPYVSTLVVDDLHKQETKQPINLLQPELALFFSLVATAIALAAIARSLKK